MGNGSLQGGMFRRTVTKFVGASVLLTLVATGISFSSTTAVLGTTSASAATDCLTAATAIVKKAEAAPKANYPKVAFNMSKDKGKSVWLIEPDDAGIVATIGQAVANAAKVAGIKLHTFNANAAITGMNQGVMEAVSAHAKGIILLAVAESYIPNAVSAAAAAKIPIIDTFDGNPSDPLTQDVKQHVTVNWTSDGKIMGALGLVNTSCALNADILSSSLYTIFAEVAGGVTTEVNALCPTCTIATTQIPNIGDAATEVPQLVSSQLTSDPATNYFYAPSDNVVGLISSAITADNDAGKVFAIGHDGTAINLEAMGAGGPEVGDMAFDIANVSSTPLGYELIDSIGRVMAGVKTVPENLPVQLFVPANLPYTSNKALFASVTAPGPVFKKLWAPKKKK
jgi:ribose transport system substrate-binding protein